MLKESLHRLRPQPTEGSTGLSTGDLAAIQAYFAALDQQEKGLSQDAFTYVLEGTGDGVLLRIANANAPNRAPGLAIDAFSRIKDRPDRRIFMELEGWDALAIMRLGKVIIASLKGSWRAGNLPGTDTSPEFFRALAHVGADCIPLTPLLIEGQSWLLTGARCIELLAQEKADHATLVDVMFGELEPDNWRSHSRARLLTMPGLAEVFAEAPDQTLTGARALDKKGRSGLIEFLGSQGIADHPAFFDFLIDMVAAGGKREVEAALSSLKSCTERQICDRAIQLLRSEQANDRQTAVLVLANAGTSAARSLIERHAPLETSRKVRQAIQEVLQPLRRMEQTGAETGTSGYTAIDGEWIAISPADPIPPDPLPPGNMAAELSAAAAAANQAARLYFFEYQSRVAELPAEIRKHQTGPTAYEDPYSLDAIPDFIDVMAGRLAPHKAGEPVKVLGGSGNYFYHTASQPYLKRLDALLSGKDVTLHHLARLALLSFDPYHRWASSLFFGTEWGTPALRLLSKTVATVSDFRPILNICSAAGGGSETFLTEILNNSWGGAMADEVESRGMALWPFVAEHLDLIDRALGLAPTPPDMNFQVIRALELLAILPAPPRRYLQVLLDLSIGGHKDHKVLARAILSSAAGITDLILPLLKSGELSRRIGAADWLRARRDRQAVPSLRAALHKEKTDAGRAALLIALTVLGDDVSDQFSEKRLLAEAKAGLAKMKTRIDACIPLDHLPALTWNDGRSVPVEVVRWWIVLADKLKSARGNPMLNIALDRLEKSSAERLGIFVMTSFIAYDVRRPTDQEANAIAEANADSVWKTYRTWDPNFTRQRAVAMLKNQHLGKYFQSAIDHRGALALARRVPASEAVGIVKAYFRDHYQRPHQCRALLDALSNNPSPAALQFVLGISMRYRTNGVRKHAAALVKIVAEDRGWTRDELTDRTVPTGGLDEAGVLTLIVGDKTYTASLDPDFKVLLRNPAGKLIQALPSGDDETAAKKAFADLKKEVRQTVQQQRSRLYEAMCAGRVWQSADIDAYMFRHPIIGQLCRHLIFAGLDQNGHAIETFRPLGDGSLTDSRDELLDAARFAGIRIAHRALLDEAQTKAWQQHLSDYEIRPLFEQLARPFLGADTELATQTAIKDREGFMLDTFKLRGAAIKLGYQRGQGEDGGYFTVYEKAFPMTDRVALIEFTGNQLPEGNVPCALIGLSFVRDGKAPSRSRSRALSLSAVPPVLLSETWNDLRTIAAAGSGFDPDWQQKSVR